jgi:hypothetical protein
VTDSHGVTRTSALQSQKHDIRANGPRDCQVHSDHQCDKSRDRPLDEKSFTFQGAQVPSHLHPLCIVILFALWCCISALDLYTAEVETLSAVTAVSERIVFEVTQPHLAGLWVSAMRMDTSTRELAGKCVEGLLTPALGTQTIYGRAGFGPFSIELYPQSRQQGSNIGIAENSVVGAFEPWRSGISLSLHQRVYLESDHRCASSALHDSAHPSGSPEPSFLLPIWGRVSIGSEFAAAEGPIPTPRLLLEGKLTFSARAVTFSRFGLLRWVLKTFGQGSILRPTLYPVAVLELPAGSRLETYSDGRREQSRASGLSQDTANWWGTVYIQPGKPGLCIAAATDTPKLALYRPNSHTPDIIEVTALNQMFGDPNLTKLFKLFAVIATVSSACTLVVRTLTIEKRGKEKRWEQP